MKRKKLFQSVVDRANGQCEVCGGRGADIHHTIFGNGKRKQHETYESLILLCMNCHHLAHSTELNYKLKKQVQEEYFNQGYSEDEVRKMMGGGYMTNKIDLTGHRYGKWFVLSEHEKRGKHIMWECVCECGNKGIVSTTSLRQKTSQSCGCLKKTMINKGKFIERENKFIKRDDYVVGITTNGKEFFIDAEDLSKVEQHCWHITSKGYVKTTIGGSNGDKMFLHRWLIKTPEGKEVDHINRVKHDNRKSNLRVCNNVQNSWNTSAKGYSFDKSKGKWRAYITVNKKRIYLGSYKEEKDAKIARRNAEKKYFKEFAPIY